MGNTIVKLKRYEGIYIALSDESTTQSWPFARLLCVLKRMEGVHITATKATKGVCIKDINHMVGGCSMT